MYNNIIANFSELDIGIYSPYSSFQQSIGVKMFDSKLNLTDNIHSKVCFLSPDIVSFSKKLNISKYSPYGWGLDILLSKYSNYIGKNIIIDKSIEFSDPRDISYSKIKSIEYSQILNSNLIQPIIISNRKVHFITFGDTISRYNNSRIRIINEAKNLNYFDTITGYSEKSSELLDFFNEHKEFVYSNKRGFGYWIWKFKIILETFKKINMNDIVVYLDSGCIFNKDHISRLKEYVELTTLNDLLAFKLPEMYKEYIWTKGDILKEFYCDKDCYDTNQIMDGIIMSRKCPRMINFFTTLLKYSISNNYNFINDSHSISPNIQGFNENRHDQSIFSVAIKTILKNKVALLENEVDPHCPPIFGNLFPILAKRM